MKLEKRLLSNEILDLDLHNKFSTVLENQNKKPSKNIVSNFELDVANKIIKNKTPEIIFGSDDRNSIASNEKYLYRVTEHGTEPVYDNIGQPLQNKNIGTIPTCVRMRVRIPTTDATNADKIQVIRTIDHRQADEINEHDRPIEHGVQQPPCNVQGYVNVTSTING